jgi:hypothetical protein
MDENRHIGHGGDAYAGPGPSGAGAAERMDVAAAIEAVARALVARQHPVIEQYAEARETRSYQLGKVEGQREALRMILAQRGLAPDGLQRGSIEDCDDPDVLERWLRRAAVATHADEIFLGRMDQDVWPGDVPGGADGGDP